jgi:hypothetical protein
MTEICSNIAGKLEFGDLLAFAIAAAYRLLPAAFICGPLYCKN